MYKLYKVKIETDEDNIYSFTPDDSEAPHYSIKANPEMVQRLLRKCGSADELTSPRSVRGLTYAGIVQNILNGSDNSVYIFAHRYPKTLKDLQDRMSR